MIFVDSSFIISYEIEEDVNHTKADKMMGDILDGKYGKIFISNFIFDECVTVVFVKSKNLSLAIKSGENLKRSTELLEVDHTIFNGSWDLFKNQKGTKFSFTDCTTLALMKKEDITNIATFDGDFKSVKGITVIGYS